nr:MAG TPA: hypothetical protein [Caudoviricetes sp.]
MAFLCAIFFSATHKIHSPMRKKECEKNVAG